MISPFKAVLGGDYKAVEKRLLAAIHIRFGLPPALPDCASARPGPNPTNSNSDTRPVPIERRMTFCICVAFKFLKKKC